MKRNTFKSARKQSSPSTVPAAMTLAQWCNCKFFSTTSGRKFSAIRLSAAMNKTLKLKDKNHSQNYENKFNQTLEPRGSFISGIASALVGARLFGSCRAESRRHGHKFTCRNKNLVHAKSGTGLQHARSAGRAGQRSG